MTDNEQQDIRLDKATGLVQWHVAKFSIALRWIDTQEDQQKRPIVQGAIFACDFGNNIGNEINKTRPCVVVSNNTMNIHDGNVVVVPLTKTQKVKLGSDRKIPRYPTHYFLHKEKYIFLADDSTVVCSQMRSVSRIRLTTFIGMVDDEDLNRIFLRIKAVFGFKK